MYMQLLQVYDYATLYFPGLHLSKYLDVVIVSISPMIGYSVLPSSDSGAVPLSSSSCAEVESEF